MAQPHLTEKIKLINAQILCTRVRKVSRNRTSKIPEHCEFYKIQNYLTQFRIVLRDLRKELVFEERT
jgi:hypothetical protein